MNSLANAAKPPMAGPRPRIIIRTKNDGSGIWSGHDFALNVLLNGLRNHCE
jgi:hypothetical protein